MVVALNSCPARLRHALSCYLSLDFGLFNWSFTFLLMLTFSFDLWQLEGSPIVVAQNEKFDGKEFSEFVCCKIVQSFWDGYHFNVGGNF